MRFFSAKNLIFTFFALNSLVANAALYKYTFPSSRYADQNTPDVPGTISAFIIIDTDIAGSQSLYTNGQATEFDIPDWIVQASITFTPETGSSVASQTRTLTSTDPINRLRWQTKGSFDPTAEFVSQMNRFSLSNGGDFTASGSLIQQFAFDEGSGLQEGEFLLSNPVNSVEVPGPLPLLGLIPFAYYFKKLKKRLKSN